MKRIIKIDASSLKESACDLKFWNIVVEGYTTELVPNDMQYGTAVHKFVEVMFRSGGDFKSAVNAARTLYIKPCIIKKNKQHLTVNHLIKTCIDLWQEFIQKDDFEYFILPDGLPAVELTFSLKMYEDENCEIYLEGTIDKFGKIKNGCYAIGDYKTTASYDPTNYFEPYRLSPQLKTYVFALKEKARIEVDSPLAKIVNTPIGAFIDGIFLSSTKQSEFKRSEVIVFKEDQLEEYEYLLKKSCWNLAEMFDTYTHNNGMLPIGNGKINGLCDGKWGLCKYFSVCASPDATTQKQLLAKNFIKKDYQPLLFGKE